MLELEQISIILAFTAVTLITVFIYVLIQRARLVLAEIRRPAVKDYIEAYVVAINLDGEFGEPKGFHF